MNATTTNPKTSAELRDEMSAICADARIVFARVTAVRMLIQQLRAEAIAQLAHNKGGEDSDNANNNIGPVHSFAVSASGATLAAAVELERTLADCETFKANHARIYDLKLAIWAAEDREAKLRGEIAESRAEVEKLQAEAVKKALEAADKTPALQSARQRLTALMEAADADIAREMQEDLH